MTPEELLKPRYKVIAQYPFSRHPTGEIIKAITGTYFDQYPHLFKKLQWWEDRKPEDMPEYVKSEGIIYKPIWIPGLETENGQQPMRVDLKDGYDSWAVISNVMCHFEPATEAEYLEYIKNK